MSQKFNNRGLIDVEIEISMNSYPVKYELDKRTGKLVVDRILSTPMHYPCNYGFIPDTLSRDGDPTDVLVLSQFPLHPGVIVECRIIGILKMTDEAGIDAKILAVPSRNKTSKFNKVRSHKDVPSEILNRIQHFFEHYKDLEPNKWVKIDGWGELEEAIKEVRLGFAEHVKSQLRARL